MDRKVHHVAVLLAIFASARPMNGLRIAAFNVQVFGTSKISDPVAVSTLIRIFHRYDLIVMQEIRDSSQTAATELLRKLNENLASGDQYRLETSPRLGRSVNLHQTAADWLSKRSFPHIVTLLSR